MSKKGDLLKGQAVSFDAVIAVAIFIFIVTVFFFIATHAAKNMAFQELSSEADVVPSKLSANASSLGFIEGSEVNQEKLEDFSTLTYSELKQKLGLRYDFCLHFEDEQGNIIPIDGKKGVGNPDKADICKPAS